MTILAEYVERFHDRPRFVAGVSRTRELFLDPSSFQLLRFLSGRLRETREAPRSSYQ
jgi:hypothetical protein